MDQHNDDIMSKIRSGVNKGLRVVNIRSKEAYDTVRIKNKIQSHKRKKTREMKEVGEFVYNMFKTRDELDTDSIKNKCVGVARTDQEISDFEEELRLTHENAKKELGKLKAISKPDE